MKNFLFFVAGMATMFVIILLIGLINQYEGDGYPGLTIFEKEGSCICRSQLEVFQVLEPNMALVRPSNNIDEMFNFKLLIGDENTHFYDEQKINIPNGKCAKQIGTYQYEAKNGVMKTVPVVEIK